MPDDNRFAGLSEVVEEESDEDDTAGGSEADAAASVATDSADTETDPDSVSDDPVEASDDDSELEPEELENGESDETDTESEADDTPADPAAFPFDATIKKTVYVRGETIDDLEDARALVDAQLRTDHDVRDLTGREFYDAVFRLAADDTDGLIEEIRDERDD